MFKKCLLIFLLSISSVYADTCSQSLMPLFTANQAVKACAAFPALTSAGISFTTAGQSVILVPYTATAAATPVAGTNLCKAGLCVIPTTAANNAVFIGAATPTVGTRFSIRNSGANTVRAKSAGGATINGSVAGGYIGLATNTSLSCFYGSAGDLTCDSYSGGAVPTPAGP